MIDKIRNIIYDKNDIIVALCIILIAALVITNRMSAIFAFPETQALALAQQKEETLANAGNEAGNGTDGETPSLAGDGAEGDGAAVQPPAPSGVLEYASIYVADGDTATVIAQNLVNGKLVESVEVFLAAVDAADAHTRLRAGEFTFPVGSTPEEIVATLTR